MNTHTMFSTTVTVFVAAVALISGCKKTETVTEFREPEKQLVQVERMGIPAINTALIPSNMKDAFNQGEPRNDVANFRSTAENTITALRAAVDPVLGPQDGGPLGNLTPAQVAGALIPDVVTIDFSQSVQFPNGRRLEDDIIDIALGVVLNRGGGAGISDAINANDKPFLSTFPYLAAESLPLSKPSGN
jgi:hypothetical protein